MFKRLAKKIAQKHMELRYPQQPLRLQPDYGERNASDFLGENVVQVNMGIDPLKGGPGNVEDEVLADDFEAEELEGFEIVDDMGLDRMASSYSSLIRTVESKLRGTPLSVELESDYDGTDLLIQWDRWDVWEEEEYEDIDDIDMDDETEGMIEREELYKLLSEVYTLVQRKHKGFVERGTSDISEGVYRIRIHDDNIRSAKDHEQSGSYMSRQNLREMSDMADFIVDDIGMEGLDDWVEDKISQSYAALNDVARYRGYRDDHPHGDEESTFKFADDEIIDDMDIMAEFDKYSRYSKGEKGSKEYADAKAEGKVPEEFLEYEGSVTTPGSSPNPSVVEKNRKELKGESPNAGLTALDRLAHYDIIDDLEW